MNLNTLSLKELKDLRSQVDRAIVSYEDRRKKEALNELQEKARAMGFSWEELTGVPAPKKRGSISAARYANPDDPRDTWTGKGRKPNWYLDALAAGKSPEDLAI